MDKNELMLGNWVFDKTPCQIEELLKDHWVDTKGNSHKYEDTQPLEVDENTLQHFNFVLTKNIYKIEYHLGLPQKDLWVNYYRDGDIELISGENLYNISYVHQLQNIMKYEEV